MPIEINGVTLYTAQEVAKRFHTSPGMIGYWRREGRIESTLIGLQHYFTEEQIKNADIEPRTRGRRKLRTDEDDDGPAHAGAA